jgi:hypothetical protein
MPFLVAHIAAEVTVEPALILDTSKFAFEFK